MLKYLVIVGAVVSFIGIANYIRQTLLGQTKPNRVTWFMWALAPLIATPAAISDGVTWAAIPVFMSGFGPLLVFISSFFNKNSYWKSTKFDYLCGLFSVLAFILWAITKNPNIAIIFAIASDGTAALPTIIKLWKHPETENISAFIGGTFSALTSFFAIQIWTFSSIGFPIYLISVNLIMIIAFYKNKLLKINS